MRRIARATVVDRVIERAERDRAGAAAPAVVPGVVAAEVDEGPYYAAYFALTGYDVCCIVSVSSRDAPAFREKYRMKMMPEVKKDITALGGDYENFLTGVELPHVPATWIIDRVYVGWNAWGATCWRHLNALTIAQSHVEFLPDVGGVVRRAIAYRVRYSSVPFIPVHPRRVRVVSALVTHTGGYFHATPAPKRLLAACEPVAWRATASADLYLEELRDQMGADSIESATAYAISLGEGYTEFTGLINESVDPNVIYKLTPATGKRSIFDNDLNAWGAFMGGFAYDDTGSISVGRALASISCSGYVGHCADVMRWKTTPSVFKIPTVMTTAVNHKTIDVDDFSQWPENFIYYNPTPQQLRLYHQISGGTPPAHIAMPITSVLANAPQVKDYGSFCDKIAVNVLFATTPLVVFTAVALDGAGFPGETIERLLPKLEQAFVRGFLLNLKELLTKPDGEPVGTGFNIKPAAGFTTKSPTVSITMINSCPGVSNTQYMTMSGDMINMLAGTPHTGDVRVDGVSVARIAGTGVRGQYPTTIIGGVPQMCIKPHDIFTMDGAYVGRGVAEPDYTGVDAVTVTPGAIRKPHLGGIVEEPEVVPPAGGAGAPPPPEPRPGPGPAGAAAGVAEPVAEDEVPYVPDEDFHDMDDDIDGVPMEGHD